MTPSRLRQFLAEAPPFAGASASVRSLIERELEFETVPGGSVLFHQGDAGDRLYIVMSGRLRASIAHEDGDEETLGEIGRGQMVGEMALIAGTDRSATVRAVRDTEVISLSQNAFERVMTACPQALMHLTRTITQRYLGRLRHGRHADGLTTLAIVPASAGACAPRLVNELRVMAAAHGSVAHVRPGDVDVDAPQARLRALEREHDLVILEADGPDTPWARRCVEAADRVLLIADGASVPEPGMTWSRLRDEVAAHSAARWDLALSWRNGSIHDTARWLATGEFDRWYHLRAGHPDDIARLARFVCGRAIGLVLSGGGARAFVHFGVIRALRDARVPIDAVGGSSMGAVIAGMFATHARDSDMMETARRSFVDGKPLGDVTIPAVSLVTGRRISRLLEQGLGDVSIEDLHLPTFAVSSSLTRGCAVEHRHGSLWRAARASVAIPGIISPSVRDGEVLVDGGVSDNLPVRSMLRMGVGHVIAVDATVAQDARVGLTDRDSCLARDLLRRQPDGSAGRPPGIFETLLRSVSLGQSDACRFMREDVDLHLSPDTGDLGMLEWKCLDRAEARGHAYAAPHVEQWRDAIGIAPRSAAA